MSEARLGHLDPVSGRASDVRVVLTGLSFRETSKGRRYPYPGFGSDFIDALHRALPRPRRRGLLRWALVCPACGSPLDTSAAGPVTVATEIVLARIPPIRVEVAMPGIVCPACHRSVVSIDDRDRASDLSDALIAAFDAARIAPG